MKTGIRTLVAGVGNVFLGDDAFGVEVVRRLSRQDVPTDVKMADFGIRGIHLAYEILEAGYETVILVDATPVGGEPGTVYWIEPDPDPCLEEAQAAGDAHSMTPDVVLALLRSLGAMPPRLWIVGCEPASTDEQMGLSEPVERGVDEAVQLVRQLIDEAGCPPNGDDKIAACNDARRDEEERRPSCTSTDSVMTSWTP